MPVPDLVIIVPMLRRAHRVAPLIESVTEATPCDHRILFVATVGDAAVIDAVNETGLDLLTLRSNSVGDYATKINTGYRNSTEKFIFLGADDLHFHPGWFEAAVQHFDDPTVGVVGTQDLANSRVRSGLHATHSLVRRSYIDEHGTIDELGKILHEGYIHEFVDDEFVGTARARGAWRFEHESVVEHLHPIVGKAPSDEMYEESPLRMRHSAHLYRRRQRLWM